MSSPWKVIDEQQQELAVGSPITERLLHSIELGRLAVRHREQVLMALTRLTSELTRAGMGFQGRGVRSAWSDAPRSGRTSCWSRRASGWPGPDG